MKQNVVDEMLPAYITARISHRWPMILIFSMVNLEAINARFNLLSINKP